MPRETNFSLKQSNSLFLFNLVYCLLYGFFCIYSAVNSFKEHSSLEERVFFFIFGLIKENSFHQI